MLRKIHQNLLHRSVGEKVRLINTMRTFSPDKNPLGIKQPCIIIANNEVLFEQYKIVLKRDKDEIDIEGEDEIKRNQLFFDFMLIMFDHLNQLYEKEKSLLIYTILKYHLRKESAKEN